MIKSTLEIVCFYDYRENSLMIVIYSMDMIKCIRTPMVCKSLLQQDVCYDEANECIWIIPGMFDSLYND